VELSKWSPQLRDRHLGIFRYSSSFSGHVVHSHMSAPPIHICCHRAWGFSQILYRPSRLLLKYSSSLPFVDRSRAVRSHAQPFYFFLWAPPTGLCRNASKSLRVSQFRRHVLVWHVFSLLTYTQPLRCGSLHSCFAHLGVTSSPSGHCSLSLIGRSPLIPSSEILHAVQHEGRKCHRRRWRSRISVLKKRRGRIASCVQSSMVGQDRRLVDKLLMFRNQECQYHHIFGLVVWNSTRLGLQSEQRPRQDHRIQITPSKDIGCSHTEHRSCVSPVCSLDSVIPFYLANVLG
jgi:hypothetical protein